MITCNGESRRRSIGTRKLNNCSSTNLHLRHWQIRHYCPILRFNAGIDWQTAFSIHPVEAMHGDLGMVSDDDLLIVISHSGRTKELQVFCDAVKCKKVLITKFRIGILPHIKADHTITYNADEPQYSTLPRQIPFVSSVVVMGIVSGVVAEVASQLQLTEEDYSKLHPDGDFGKQLTKCMDVCRPIHLVTRDKLIIAAADTITTSGSGCVGVTEDLSSKKLIGIVTDGDIRRSMNRKADYVNEIMTTEPVVIRDTEYVYKARDLMTSRKISEIPVIDSNGNPVGLISLKDI